MITDSNHACFAKMATCGFQEEVNKEPAQYLGGVLGLLKARISCQNRKPIY
jgi:hypothetical protein